MILSIFGVAFAFAGGFLSGFSYARVRAAQEAAARAERRFEDDARVLREQSEIMTRQRSPEDVARDLDSGSF